MKAKTVITYFIALVWLINGLVCKVLNLVPRHQKIVSQILENEQTPLFTKLIGFSEIIMAVWVISRFRSKLNAIVQIIVIAIMNILEFILVPYLLLWGRWNLFLALLFIILIYYNEFILKTKNTKQ